MTTEQNKTNYPALYTLITVFFFWGFIAAGNSIFIPFCKSHFSLSQFESQLIGSAFYAAYFLGSLILYLLSSAMGYDILNKIGYKKVYNCRCYNKTNKPTAGFIKKVQREKSKYVDFPPNTFSSIMYAFVSL